MSGPRRYHSHPNMAEPCVVPDDPRRWSWRDVAMGAAELGVFLLIVFAILAAIVVAGSGSVRPL